MKCPIDDSTLSVSSREGVEIDFCPQCRGVWLDRGELDKIIDRVTSAMAPPSGSSGDQRWDDARPSGGVDDRRYEERRYDDRRDPRYDDRHKRRKKRNFLEDLFDFD